MTKVHKNIQSITERHLLSGWQNNAWRFFPIGDPLVDLAMFRDLDSDFIERELAAVDQWLKSELTFHVMRDTPAQGLTPVLGMQVIRSGNI